jgi:hypothetical protein
MGTGLARRKVGKRASAWCRAEARPFADLVVMPTVPGPVWTGPLGIGEVWRCWYEHESDTDESCEMNGCFFHCVHGVDHFFSPWLKALVIAAA